MLRRVTGADGAGLAWLVGAGGLGALGLLPGAGGAFDAVTLLGWLALVAPAAGAVCGGARLGLFPFALGVPAVWACALVLAEVRAPRGMATPGWALCALTGLFALGLAAGARARGALRCAGLLAFVTVALALLPVGFGLLAGGTALAREHPAAAALLLDLSPLVLVFDCAGWDWTHAQPEVYARAGVEWFQRRAYRGELAGPLALVVGCATALWIRPSVRAT